jgi:hypothetical protein
MPMGIFWLINLIRATDLTISQIEHLLNKTTCYIQSIKLIM